MFVGKASSLPLVGAPERGFTWVGSDLPRKHYTKHKILARDRRSILLQKFVTYARKKFYNIGPRSLNIKAPVIFSPYNKLERLSSVFYICDLRSYQISGAPYIELDSDWSILK